MGGGKPLCQKLLNILFKFTRLSLKNFKQKFLFRQNLSSKGAILIEFAFCLPVLILLIYYIHDLYRYKRYYSRMEFVAQQIASMIQNISQSRESKAITQKDLQYIYRTAFLSIFPGMSMYKQNGCFELGYQFSPCIFYVKGLENGNATAVWVHRYYASWGISDHGWCSINDFIFFRPVFLAKNVAPSKIYPSLTISPGEVKIIVLPRLIRSPHTISLNGEHVSDKQAFNFYLLSPKYLNLLNEYYFFPSVVIFTPRPGLFSETAP